MFSFFSSEVVDKERAGTVTVSFWVYSPSDCIESSELSAAHVSSAGVIAYLSSLRLLGSSLPSLAKSFTSNSID
jgi:hypothetical protein